MRRGAFPALWASLIAATAGVYPTAVVFTPTAEAMPGGTVGVFIYTSINLGPNVSPGPTWLGGQVGILPQFSYGRGLRFGGLEVGVDVIAPYANTLVKPVFNAKLGLCYREWIRASHRRRDR